VTRPLSDRAVLVTGAHGFLGRHAGRALRDAGASVFCPPRSSYDLRDRAAVDRLFADVRPEVVVHLAALCGGIGFNRAHPGRLWHDNLLMGLHALDACRAAGAKLVLVGTTCSYPLAPPVPFREESLYDGYPEPTNAAYGLAKRALLDGLTAYRAEYGLRGCYLIPANLYGPGDRFDPERSHVIPALIRRFAGARAAGERRVTLWGTGAATRDFLYAPDAADAIARAAATHDGAEPVNLGGRQEIPVRELAGFLARLCGYAGEIAWDGQHPDGQPRRVLDATRAETLLGWRATTPLDEGLRATVTWFRARQP